MDLRAALDGAMPTANGRRIAIGQCAEGHEYMAVRSKEDAVTITRFASKAGDEKELLKSEPPGVDWSPS